MKIAVVGGGSHVYAGTRGRVRRRARVARGRRARAARLDAGPAGRGRRASRGASSPRRRPTPARSATTTDWPTRSTASTPSDPAARGWAAARLLDETIPGRVRLVGQETTGPGGFAKALRTVPVVLDIADEPARRYAQPDAWIVDFTNPVGIVTRALLRRGASRARPVQRGDRLPAAPRRRLRRRADRVELDHVGLNHLTWDPGRPHRRLRPAARTARRSPRGLRASSACRSSCCVCWARSRPTTCTTSTARRGCRRAADERAARAEEVLAIERELLRMYADPRSTTSRRCSSSAAAPTTARPRPRSSPRSTGDGARHYVDSATTRRFPDCRSTPSSRCRHSSTATGRTPWRWHHCVPEMLGLVQAVTQYEVFDDRGGPSRRRRRRCTGAAGPPARRASGRTSGAARRHRPRERGDAAGASCPAGRDAE